jgi:hypothetical protein
MMTIMLCGAADTTKVAAPFAEVTRALGGVPWHYRSEGILYHNAVTASWERNARRSVAGADLCVFVIAEKYGAITWKTELQEALDSGRPFLILCLDSTYSDYLTLTGHVRPTAIADPDTRLLVEALTELESERQLTVTTFRYDTFAEIYRREAAKVFGAALEALTLRTRREALYGLLGAPADLTRQHLIAAEQLATDEFEDKNRRKLAVAALAARGAASPDVVLALLHSREQGVQRYAAQRLSELYTQRPPEPEFMEDCVTLANESDDVGIVRRLIPALLDVDLTEAIRAFEGLDKSEVGTRRRLAAELERREAEIRSAGLTTATATLLRACLAKTDEVGWLARCRSYLDRLDGT